VKTELLIGSGNLKKAEELALLLEGLPWKVLSLRDMPALPEPEETGSSFAENALLKAKYYGDAFNLPCIADDSGLSVDALQGAPGVHSARYAGPDATDEENNIKLLQALSDCVWHERSARFVCCAVFYEPGGESHMEEGEIHGHISVAPYGCEGFGYDPLFVPAGEERCFAEMSLEEKQKISHRGQAFEKMRAFLEQRS
jgi:XTP/dITP diphosphohydrolase